MVARGCRSTVAVAAQVGADDGEASASRAATPRQVAWRARVAVQQEHRRPVDPPWRTRKATSPHSMVSSANPSKNMRRAIPGRAGPHPPGRPASGAVDAASGAHHRGARPESQIPRIRTWWYGRASAPSRGDGSFDEQPSGSPSPGGAGRPGGRAGHRRAGARHHRAGWAVDEQQGRRLRRAGAAQADEPEEQGPVRQVLLGREQAGRGAGLPGDGGLQRRQEGLRQEVRRQEGRVPEGRQAQVHAPPRPRSPSRRRPRRHARPRTRRP